MREGLRPVCFSLQPGEKGGVRRASHARGALPSRANNRQGRAALASSHRALYRPQGHDSTARATQPQSTQAGLEPLGASRTPGGRRWAGRVCRPSGRTAAAISRPISAVIALSRSGRWPARPGTAVFAIHEAMTGPAFQAAMELWTASRTGEELREALLPAERRLGPALREVFDRAAESPTRPPTPRRMCGPVTRKRHEGLTGPGAGPTIRAKAPLGPRRRRASAADGSFRPPHGRS